jgi:NADH:ubiquinone oxidoreductase subunit 2 (subunit N)
LDNHLEKLLEDNFFTRISIPNIQEGFKESLGVALRLGALAKTNPILAMIFSITMFSYARMPLLADFYNKFYLFFATNP